MNYTTNYHLPPWVETDRILMEDFNEAMSGIDGGIAAAKARGVKFGRPPAVLPENFHAVHKKWRDKKITLRQAAKACGMPEGTFYSKARKFEEGEK